MSTSFPSYVSVDYSAGTNEDPSDYPTLEAKLEQAVAVTKTGLETYERPAVLWTGGKDSTLVLYILNEVAEEFGYDLPPAIFIDHYQHFDAVHDFIAHWADEWETELIYAQNEDVGRYVDNNTITPGDDIPIAALNEQNQHHVRTLLEYEEESFPFLLDTYVGNHLLKTVALNNALEQYDIDGIFSGVRWDEQDARAAETFFSPRHDPDIYPPHDRIQPILQFDEPAVWDAFWDVIVPESVDGYPTGHVPADSNDLPNDLSVDDIPVSPKYFDGFRSLGSEVSTERSATQPAWHQDLERTTERAGRAQDKEDLMERLRDLGYM